jgi:TolB-like protein
MISLRTSNVPFLFTLLLVFSACSGLSKSGKVSKPLRQRPALSTQVAEGFVPFKVNQIAVLPFEGEAMRFLDSNVTGQIDQRLVKALNLYTSLDVVNASAPKLLAGATSSTQVMTEPLFKKAAHYGREVGAQGVLCGLLSSYQSSNGTKYGATQPASVGFRLWLIDPKTTKVLWSATYRNSDQPLSENLLAIRQKVKNRHLRYLGAPALLEDGFEKASRSLEQTRQASIKN